MNTSNNLASVSPHRTEETSKNNPNREKTSKAGQLAQKHFKRVADEIGKEEGEKRAKKITESSKKIAGEMGVSFIHGTQSHIETYVRVIDEAEGHVIIASWNLNFIPKEIFSSLMRAKNRGVSISFVVQSVKRPDSVKYFRENDQDDYSFTLFETKSHAKFLFVDSTTLVLGSYNALGDPCEESLDASLCIKGSIKQLWPFYMSIYETYTDIGEDLGSIFDGLAMISKVRHPEPRPLLQISFDDQSKIFLLRTIKEHEDFLKLATPYNGDVSIYSPFSTKDNTFKRLQSLHKFLPIHAKIHLKVLPKFQNGLARLVSEIDGLQNRITIETVASHQKIVILGNETLCIGSLNWLSAAQDDKASYSNVELSVVLQGPKAAKIIKGFFKY